MSTAYLTIDDCPTKNTSKIMDYLKSKNIKPVLFSYGKQLEKYFEEAVYALKNGAIIGNHSYSHPNFNELTWEECQNEIEKQEELLCQLYKAAGIERKYKIFRFPYGAKGGKNKETLQEYFRKNNFCRIDDRKINGEWYKQNGLNRDIDVLWTFDFAEYRLHNEDNFTFDSIMNRIHDQEPEAGGVLLEKDSHHIILIHDHEKSEEILPGYFKTLIDYVTEHGVEFIPPEFITF